MSNQNKVITGLTQFPNKPLFLINLSPSVNNVTGNATVYTIIFNNAIINQGNVFNTTTGTFTANVSGSYHIGFNVDLRNLGAANTSGDLAIITSNRSYAVDRANYGAIRDASNLVQRGGHTIVDMDKDDTATFTVRVQNGGADTVSVFGQATPQATWCWGVFEG